MQNKPHIILVDDHLLFRQSLKSVITMEDIAIIIGEATNGLELIELLSNLHPDLVLVDIDMPQMNGFEATQKALELMPDLKIIVYTMFEEEDYYAKMIALGVKGFIIKSGSINELEKAINEVLMGNTYFSDSFQSQIINPFENTNATDPNISLISSEHTESLNSDLVINPIKQ